MKKYIVSFGYTHLVLDSKTSALDLLEAIPVDKDYVGGEHIYKPTKEKEVTVNLVDESFIRSLTEEEQENKELAEAKRNADWAKNENKGLKKEVEDLKCQIKVLLKKEEGETL